MSTQNTNPLGELFGGWLATFVTFWDPARLTTLQALAGQSPRADEIDLAYQLINKWQSTGLTVPGPRTLVFPQDHGEHWDTPIEWRYFTFSLTLSDGSTFSLICNLFRKAIATAATAPNFTDLQRQVYSPSWAWSLRGADGTVTHYAIPNQTLAPVNGDPVVMQTTPFVFQVGTCSIISDGPDDIFPLKIHMEDSGDTTIGRPRLSLDVRCEATNPLFLQGLNGFVGTPPPGKNEQPENGTLYYSWAQQQTTGTVTIGNKPLAVETGITWLDHQWGGSLPPAGNGKPPWAGWMWFEFQFDGKLHPTGQIGHLSITFSSVGLVLQGELKPPFTGFGTMVVHGATVAVSVTVEVTRFGPPSPRTGTVYPTGWTIKVAGLVEKGIDLTLEAFAQSNDETLMNGHCAEYSEAPATAVITGSLGDRIVALTGVGYCEANGLENPDTRDAIILDVLRNRPPG